MVCQQKFGIEDREDTILRGCRKLAKCESGVYSGTYISPVACGSSIVRTGNEGCAGAVF